MTPFRIHEGEWVLRAMLREAGVDPDAPRSAREVWEVFKRFLDVPSDASGQDADGVLYQSGVLTFHGSDEFYLDFVRQFDVTEPDGEHDHYEQLHCEFRFPVTEQIAHNEPFELWWFAGDPPEEWDRFVRTVEARPEFADLAPVTPAAASIKQEEV